MTVPSVKDFGAVGDGVTDDRVAVQAAFDAGVGLFPPGVYLVSNTPLRHSALTVPPGLTIRGADQSTTKILLAGGVPQSTQILWIENAPDVTLRDVTLDGQRSLQGPPPTRQDFSDMERS